MKKKQLKKILTDFCNYWDLDKGMLSLDTKRMVKTYLKVKGDENI